MDPKKIKTIVEAALMAAGRPLGVDELQAVFGDFSRPERQQIRDAVKALQEEYADRAIEIKEVASGFRVQVRTRHTEYISRLWDERPPRYSRALMETLALIAYRQPITRGEIEEVRGVSVSTNIVRTLLERNWVRVVGHRDVPGRPAMFGTTKEFLDYFGLKKLDELPSLRELQDIEDLSVQLELPTGPDEAGEPGVEISGDGEATIARPKMQLVRNPDDVESEAQEAQEQSEADEVISHS
ncbi:MAG: SMC-Scp complex subunit ScpB [Gammaproteobacteria bacterium]|nr:SMC-Scp complex subunit ScpB [Gammaproteobacteria bacterium]